AANIGTAYSFEDRRPEAKRFYARALAFEPNNPLHWENFGDLLVREAKPDSAHLRYARAVQLVEGMLHVDPKNATLKLERALDLAKLDDCDGAQQALAQVQQSLSGDDADSAHQVARLNAVCGKRAAMLQATRRAIAMGIAPRLIRMEDEFRQFANDPQFIALVAAR